ncbi:succinate dehydrogenase, cytochrome b556 subunit [Coxiella endosymbiont of Amblyomma nuttalli]|uniref:succinate dehydrogenase, cytochrome b556 subunit n=1 Tax=Coxiella endosymbiont of Amblyomma nuttalli TaxID=2749996 RepID=UPI001BAAF855|nr:succinate dehydrogenase, cytochrome b556 subunit [Coxiella endosymbiont of Amblyomma nuttalli]QTS83690.1 Succinate dehydrogenase cytochrome b556 subunit [Coxiella endosymbiont of Amblyomma nuttalli]
MPADRPVNLDLTKVHFPPAAIVSICHRISGVLLFLFLPLMFYLLRQVMLSQATFFHVQQLINDNQWLKVAVWLMLVSIIFHLLAGIRHLMMDLGFLESVREGRISAYIVFVLLLISIILTGIWIW